MSARRVAARPDLDRGTRVNAWLALARDALAVASPLAVLAAAAR